MQARPDDPKEILRVRFARGEIPSDDFELRLDLLTRLRPPSASPHGSGSPDRQRDPARHRDPASHPPVSAREWGHRAVEDALASAMG